MSSIGAIPNGGCVRLRLSIGISCNCKATELRITNRYFTPFFVAVNYVMSDVTNPPYDDDTWGLRVDPASSSG